MCMGVMTFEPLENVTSSLIIIALAERGKLWPARLEPPRPLRRGSLVLMLPRAR